LLYPELIV